MKFIKIALFCTLTALTLPAQAATVTLDLTGNVPNFADSQLNNGDTTTAGGFSLTFQNVQTQFGENAVVVGEGPVFGKIIIGAALSVDLVFSVDTVIDSYAIGIAGFSGEVFQLTGVNGVSGLNGLGSFGTSAFDMGTIPAFLAGEAYTLTHTVSFFAIISAFGVSSPPPAVVPLPASLPFLLAGLGVLGILRRPA